MDRLTDTQDAVLDDELLHRRDQPLELPGFLQGFLVGRASRDELEQTADGLGVDGAEAVDGAGGVEKDDRTELLPKAGIDSEVGRVDLWVKRHLYVMRYVSM